MIDSIATVCKHPGCAVVANPRPRENKRARVSPKGCDTASHTRIAPLLLRVRETHGAALRAVRQ